MDKITHLTKLQSLRERIDTLDIKIIDLLNQRAQTALEIGKTKHFFLKNDPILRPDRESKVVDHLRSYNEGPFPDTAISPVWVEIMSACRSLECSMSVAYLGPKGSFSEQAAVEHFGHSMQFLACSSLDEVFHVVEIGKANVGMVPVENSTEGPVNRSLDLFLGTSLKILGERSLTIRHCLMTQSGFMSGITSILAHSQALAQCQEWIKQNYPDLSQVAVSSNSEAARVASEHPSIAAIASKAAAPAWNLKIVATDIQDDINNRTRFVAIGNIESAASGNDKSSLILAVPNKVGSIFRMLEPLSINKVSMTSFESRPAKTGQWEYYFYVDIRGHKDEPHVAHALEVLQNQVIFFKILGSYPMQLIFS